MGENPWLLMVDIWLMTVNDGKWWSWWLVAYSMCFQPVMADGCPDFDIEMLWDWHPNELFFIFQRGG